MPQHTLKQLWKCAGRLQVSFTAEQRGNFVKELLLPLHLSSLFSQSNRRKNLMMGGVDLVLFLPPLSPHDPQPHPPTHALPWQPDSSNPFIPSAHIEQSLTAVTWEGFKPACRYCSYFRIPIVSCCRCPYVLPLCISRQNDFVLVLLGLVFFPFSFTFGLSRNSEQRTLVHERKARTLLIVWFVVSILMKWNPTCRIFCIVHIVRQWEDGGAIWREFSYWMEPH